MKVLAVIASLAFLAGTVSVSFSTPAISQPAKAKAKSKSKPCPPGARRACY